MANSLREGRVHRLDGAFQSRCGIQQVQADPEFHFGTRFTGELDETAKRVIIELYEKATGKTATA